MNVSMHSLLHIVSPALHVAAVCPGALEHPNTAITTSALTPTPIFTRQPMSWELISWVWAE